MARETFYINFNASENLTEAMLLEVEEFSRGMELMELSDYFGFEIEETEEGKFSSSELDETELKWVIKAFKRGRAQAKKVAVDSLFASMKDRNGQNASLPYLRRFAKEWPGDDQVKEGDLLIFKANIGNG